MTGFCFGMESVHRRTSASARIQYGVVSLPIIELESCPMRDYIQSDLFYCKPVMTVFVHFSDSLCRLYFAMNIYFVGYFFGKC